MRTLKRFEKERDAEKYARQFDYARRFNGLPPLLVMPDGEQWLVVNANPDAVPQPGKA